MPPRSGIPHVTCCPPQRPPKGGGYFWGPWLWQEQCRGAAPLSSCRSDMVSVLESYYYDDGCESCGTDTFSREPFIVKFSSPTTREQSQCMAAPRWHRGLPGPGMGSPLRGAEPRAVPAGLGDYTLEPSSGTPGGSSLLWGIFPPMGAQGSWVPAQHSQHCLLFPTMCYLPSSAISSHCLASPTMHSFQLHAISPLQLFPVVSHIPSPTTSHLVPHPTICFLQLCAISHHLPSPFMYHIPSCTISHHLSSPTLCHLLSHAITSTSSAAPQGTHTLPSLSHSHILPKTKLAWKK